MQRQMHNLIQGSEAWHLFRMEHDGASEAAAVLGLSKNVTRTELLTIKGTGIAKAFSDFVQKHVLDKGHKVEALARPIVEKRIGEDLSPVTMSYGKESASCDGLTFNGDIAWECKQFNQEDFDLVASGELPEKHWPQCQQIIHVTGADKLYFTISDGTDENTAGMWVYPDQSKIQLVLDAWAQFRKDLVGFVPPEVIEKPKTVAVESFPMVAIQVKGELVECNLTEVLPRFDKFLKETKTDLETDDDFGQADVDAKASREAAKQLKMQAQAVIDQMLPVSDAIRTLKSYAEKFDELGLTLEKAVKTQKENIKTKAILEAKDKLTAHCNSLAAEVNPIRMSWPVADFATAIKGLKTITSMHDRINTCLANAIIESDALARDIRSKLAWFNEATKDHKFLFNDLQQIIFKAQDDFELLCETRIRDHKVSEDAKAEKIRKDELTRIENERIERERLENQKKVVVPEPVAEVQPEPKPSVTLVTNALPAFVTPAVESVATPKKLYFGGLTPTAEELVQAIAYSFSTEQTQALEWLQGVDFHGLKLAA